MTTLYHNPRCSKSRETLRLLEDAGETVEIVRYLDNPPSKKELKQIISLLGIKPIDLVRTKENEWVENYKGKTLTDDKVIDAMVKFPKLIERPIAIKGLKAAVARPPEDVLKIL